MKKFLPINTEQIYIENEEGKGEVFTFSEISEAFSHSLKELRLLYNLSGNALANILHMPQQTLNLYENNKRTPNFILAMQISSSFGLTLEDMILNGVDLLNTDLELISHYPTTIQQ